MATQKYTDGVTLTAASEFDMFDTAAYAHLTGVAGTNTITATGPASVTAYATGQLFRFIPAATNTGATTINITANSVALGAKNIFSDSAACVGGELKIGVPVLVMYDGTQFQILGRRFFKQPTQQVFLTGSGTYTTPAGATRISVRLVGGGGGGAGSGTTPGAAAAGGATTFSTLTGGGGGGGGAGDGTLGASGTATGGDVNLRGGVGGATSGVVSTPGNAGGISVFGGNGPMTFFAAIAGNAAQANTGSGGSGAGCGGTIAAGGGGGAGGYVEKLITAPAATYSYGVGALGAGGTLGTGGGAGGAGGAGIIIVDEFYS